MTKRIEVVGSQPKKIKLIDQPKRRIEPSELAAALGAKPVAKVDPGSLDLIALADLGTALLQRLRSTGGRPALADATEACRVPLSADDVRRLEEIGVQIEEAMGTKPSPGQIASVILRMQLDALNKVGAGTPAGTESKTEDREAHLLSACKGMIEEEMGPIRAELNRLAKAVGSKC
jgi:hypothetical protein